MLKPGSIKLKDAKRIPALLSMLIALSITTSAIAEVRITTEMDPSSGRERFVPNSLASTHDLPICKLNNTGRPYFPNGCALNTTLFMYEWNAQHPESPISPMWVATEGGDPDHVVAVFEWEKQLYAWDQEFGVIDLKQDGGKPLGASEAKHIKSVYSSAIDSMKTGIKLRRLEVNKPQPYDSKQLLREAAGMLAPDCRPIIMHDIKSDQEALVWFFEGRLWAYNPKMGSLNLKVEADKSYKQNLMDLANHVWTNPNLEVSRVKAKNAIDVN